VNQQGPTIEEPPSSSRTRIPAQRGAPSSTVQRGLVRQRDSCALDACRWRHLLGRAATIQVLRSRRRDSPNLPPTTQSHCLGGRAHGLRIRQCHHAVHAAEGKATVDLPTGKGPLFLSRRDHRGPSREKRTAPTAAWPDRPPAANADEGHAKTKGQHENSSGTLRDRMAR